MPQSIRFWQRCLWLVLLAASLHRPALAQREYFNWYFGTRAGVSFNGPAPVALTNSPRSFSTGVACMSDGSGQFLFASDGAQVWDRNWQEMPGRITPHLLVGFSTRQVLAVRQPGSAGRYYVFRSSNQFSNGQYPVSAGTPIYMPFVVVDMQLRGGLGGIAANDSLRLPNWTLHVTAPYYYPNTNFTAVRHANGQDLWIVTQTDEGQYVSYLLTAAGLARQPVVSQSIRNIFYASNGILKASGDGKTLASVSYFGDNTQAYTSLDIARFDPATGQVSSFYTLPSPYRGRVIRTSANQWTTYFVRVTGLEMSPDGSRLYADTANSSTIMQYDLLAGSPAQVAASRASIRLNMNLGYQNGDMQLAPDGKIYVSLGFSEWLGRLEQPNVPGTAGGFTLRAVALGSGRSSTATLPYTTNDLNLPPVVVTSGGSIAAGSACAGDVVSFMSSLSPFVTAAAYSWNFGDPDSGPLNTAAGQAPTHRYQQGGEYTVTLRVTALDGRQFTVTQRVQVLPRPLVELGPDLTLCADEARPLSPGPQPAGSTYRWQDGSTAATLRVAGAGTYRVTVTNPAGCTATDSVAVSITDCPDLPNIITPNGDPHNETFVLKGLHAPDWDLTIYNRWGRQVYQLTGYNNAWNAAGLPDGPYYYLVRNPSTGQQLRGWLQVSR